MIKKIINILCLLLLSLIMLISIYNSILLIIVDYILPVTICMIINYSKKKNLFYKICMDILVAIFSLFIIFILYNLLRVSLTWDTFEVLLVSLNHIIVNILLYLNILNIKKKDDSKYFYANLIATSIIILIYLNYYFNPLFIHNIISNDMISYYSNFYINQNYPYFLIIEICLLIYYFLNNKLKEK